MKRVSTLATDRQLYLRLLGYILPYWQIFLLSILAMLVQAVAEPAKAYLLEPMLDQLFVDQDQQMMLLIPLAIIVVFTISGIAAFAAQAGIHWVSTKIVMDLRNQMFGRLITLSGQFYDRHSTGSLISKFTFEALQVKEACSTVVTVFIKDFLMVIGLLSLMFYTNWQLSSIALIYTPFIALIVYLIRTRLRRMSQKVQATMAEMNYILGEAIDGHRIVKVFAGQQQEKNRFSKSINANRQFIMKFLYATVASGPAVQLIAATALAVIVYLAASQSFVGRLSVGEFGTFFVAMTMLMNPLKRLVRVNEYVQKGLAACESIFTMIEEPGEKDEGTIELANFKGELELRNLSYRYHGNESDVLHKINILIKRGETIALVGSSGAGKTTLADLLPRFYQLEKGSIFIDGHDIHDIPLSQLRANIALVNQDVTLFNDTVHNNITYGCNRNASKEAVEKIIKAAYVKEFIKDLPNGMDTIVGEKGSRLSGGQRQRIALARALLKGSPILILDEATSALDTESERYIQQALNEIRREKTNIIIAHRLSTIENADRVIVLDKGKIIETGNHSELLEKDGMYAKFYLATKEEDQPS